MVSDGEYMPIRRPKQQRHVEYRVKELADEAAQKLGTTRRKFLLGTGGMAAALIAMNDVYGKKFFKVDSAEMYETAAYEENGMPPDVFVFDDQTHIVRSSMNGGNGLRALAQGPGPASTAAGYTTNPFNGTGGNAAGPENSATPGRTGTRHSSARPSHPNPHLPSRPWASSTWGSTSIVSTSSPRQASRSSATQISRSSLRPAAASRQASNIAESLVSEILTGYQTSQCRDFINKLAGSRRARPCPDLPRPRETEDPAFGDYTQWQIEYCQPDRGRATASLRRPAPILVPNSRRGGSMILRSPTPPMRSSTRTGTSSGSTLGSSTSAFTRDCLRRGRNLAVRTTCRITGTQTTSSRQLRTGRSSTSSSITPASGRASTCSSPCRTSRTCRAPSPTTLTDTTA